MKKFIITISREFGCNAREVARKAAAELGVEFYDKDLVDMAAERAGISRDSFLDSEEMLDKNADRLLKSFGYGSSTQFYSDKAVKAQVDIIRDLANKRISAIFFGRCADYVLREYPNHMNVFLYAPLEARIKHMCETYDLSWPEAGSTVIVEQVFSLPGIGGLLISAIEENNFPIVQILVLFMLGAYLVMSFVIDILYTVLDPRVDLK